MRIQANVISTTDLLLWLFYLLQHLTRFLLPQAQIIQRINLALLLYITTTEKTFLSSIATNPVKPNTTNPTTSLTSVPSSSSTYTNTDNYLWRHVYNVDNGEPWGQKSSRLNITPNSQYNYGSCVTVTGQVYSIYPPPSPERGTHDEPDGDLQFTLALDQKYSKSIS
jgi:hypothetical protein